MGKRVGIQDVAREAGVSKTSVSNYLNGRDEKLSQETRDRIRDTMARLRYAPSLGARSISSKSASKTIGAIIRHDLGYLFNTRFFAQVMQGIGAACDRFGYRVLVLSSRPSSRDEDLQYALSLSRGIVDGFLLFELVENDPYAAAFRDKQVPFICFGRPEEDDLYPWVASDQDGAMVTVVAHLAGHGLKRIALYPGHRGSLVATRRVAGFRRGLEESMLPWDEALVRYSYGEDGDLYPEYLRMLSMEGGPDSFVFPQSQLGCFRRALEATGKLADPPPYILADFFGGDEERGESYTYVKGHVRQIGLRGAERLIDLVEGRGNGTGELFPTELIIGGSCGCRI